MSRITLNRNKLRLKRVFGLRARLILMALILVSPLMIDRIRILDDNRDQQVARTSDEFTRLAEHSAGAQRELMVSIEAVLRATAYVYASTKGLAQNCDRVRDAMRIDLPWISALSVTNTSGHIECSTADDIVGLDLSDRTFYKYAVATQGFVASDHLISRRDGKPVVITAFPISSAAGGSGTSMVVAAVRLDWLSKLMGNLGGRVGLNATVIDSQGRVIAAPIDQAAQIGSMLDDQTLPTVMSIISSGPLQQAAPVHITAQDGSRHAISVARIGGTASRLVIDINETVIAADADESIQRAYLQLALVCLLVLIGGLLAAERLIVRPITVMVSIARRFGRGDWTARAGRDGLPAEFVPLARAFNEMATQLGQRERDMLEANDRLTVMASVDVLTGLANRRGFQSRLDFEWMKAQQSSDDLALLMIDVDHFKSFNDNYGHPEGDACLAQVGDAIGAIAHDVSGFAARYGGEEFCLLLPRADAELATAIGERIRAAIQNLAIPHASTATQRVTASVGLAAITANAALSAKDVVEAADAALYAAKHRGRNTVVCHGFARSGEMPLAMAS